MRAPLKPNAKDTSRASKPRKAATKPRPPGSGESVVLLSGGNPQIEKAAGDAPVQAYIREDRCHPLLAPEQQRHWRR